MKQHTRRAQIQVELFELAQELYNTVIVYYREKRIKKMDALRIELAEIESKL